MSRNFLIAPGFSPNGKLPRFTESLIGTLPPSALSSAPFGIPRASIGNKVQETDVNSNVRAYVYGNPWQSEWERGFATGSPVFTNAKNTIMNTPEVHVATPAILNYHLEHGARLLYAASQTPHKRHQADFIEELRSQSHLACTSVQDFIDHWRFFGFLYSMMGKSTETGFSKESGHASIILNCTVQKTADILNYWGNVCDGDHLYWAVKMIDNPYDHFYDPQGRIIGSSLQSPKSFLQIVPISFGAQNRSTSHNRNWKDLSHPMRDDIDFYEPNVVYPQEDLLINMSKCEFRRTPLKMNTEVVKEDKLITNQYGFGYLIPVGIVNKGSRTSVRPSSYDLDLALRSDVKAQTLEKIQVFVQC